MAEFVTVAAQEVAQNGNVVFSNTAVKAGNCIKSLPSWERGLKFDTKFAEIVTERRSPRGSVD